MALLRMTIKCTACEIIQERVWPLGDGVCNSCLVSNFTLEQALAATCSCHHDELKRLYLKRGEEKNPPRNITEYSGPHFGNAPLPDEDW